VKKLIYLAMIFLVPAIVFGAAFIVYKVPLSTLSADDYYNQGNALYAKGFYEEASAAYEKALAIKPAFENALKNAAYVYNKIGEYQRAAQKLGELVNMKPENPSYHYDYAVNTVLNIKKSNAGTIEEIEKAIAEFKKSDALQAGYQKVKENLAFLEDMKAQYYSKIEGTA
jgi:tetratricopeptide (TPR) repeat protein